MSGAELYLIASLVSAGVKYAQSREDAKQLDNKAYQVEIEGRKDRLEYKRQGVEQLKEMNKIMSANIANAFAGNLNPYSSGETPDLIQSYSLRAGLNDWSISRDNASIAMKQAQYQADQYRRSAKQTRKFGTIGLIANVAMAGYNYSTIGSAPAQSASTSNTFLDPSYSDFGTTGTRSQFLAPRVGNRYMPSGM